MKRTIILLFIAAGACGKGGGSDTPPPSPPETKPPPKDGIEMVSTGVEPLRQLRYKPVKGTMTTLEVASDGDTITPAADKKLPTLVLIAEVSVDDVAADGTAKMRTKIVNATARERKDANVPVAAMAQMAPMFIGLTITGTLSPSGTLSDSKIDGGKDLPSARAEQLGTLAKGFEQSAMALPEVPVGVGAVWRYRKPVEQLGVISKALTTVEIVAIDGDKVTFKTTTTASGDHQLLTGSGDPIEIRDIVGTGSSTGVYDLAHVVMTGKVSSEFRATMSGLEMRMANTATMTVKN